MASEWIRKKAESEAQEAARREREQLAQLNKTALIKTLGPAFVKNLMAVFNEDIAEWNAHFGDRQINGAVAIHNGFSFAKEGYPRGSADITFNSDALRIDVVLYLTNMQGDRYTHETYVYLEANPDGKDIHMEDRMHRKHLEPSGFTHMVLENIAEQGKAPLI